MIESRTNSSSLAVVHDRAKRERRGTNLKIKIARFYDRFGLTRQKEGGPEFCSVPLLIGPNGPTLNNNTETDGFANRIVVS